MRITILIIVNNAESGEKRRKISCRILQVGICENYIRRYNVPSTGKRIVQTSRLIDCLIFLSRLFFFRLNLIVGLNFSFDKFDDEKMEKGKIAEKLFVFP